VRESDIIAAAQVVGWQARTIARHIGLSCTGSFRERVKRAQARSSKPAPVAAAVPAPPSGGVVASGDAPAWQGYRPRDGWKEPEKTAAAKAAREEVRRVAIIPDTHVPFHDRAAWSVALSVVREWEPHRVILIGDFMDTEAVSRHGKNTPDTVRLAEEYHETNLRLDELQNAAPDATWLYLEGNHENRVSKWCCEFGSMDGLLDVPEALYMKPRDEGYHRSSALLRGMEWVPLSRQPYQIDGCAYLHGVYENQHHAAFHGTGTCTPFRAPFLPPATMLGASGSSGTVQAGHSSTSAAARLRGRRGSSCRRSAPGSSPTRRSGSSGGARCSPGAWCRRHDFTLALAGLAARRSRRVRGTRREDPARRQGVLEGGVGAEGGTPHPLGVGEGQDRSGRRTSEPETKRAPRSRERPVSQAPQA
jgi:hypothetical protein